MKGGVEAAIAGSLLLQAQQGIKKILRLEAWLLSVFGSPWKNQAKREAETRNLQPNLECRRGLRAYVAPVSLQKGSGHLTNSWFHDACL